MKRVYLPLLAVAVLVLLPAFRGEPDKPRPKPPGVALAELTVVGPNVWAKWTVAATPSDSLTVDVSATGQTGIHRMYLVDAKTDSVSYPKPAPGASLTVTLLSNNWRLGKSAAGAPISKTYVEPDTVVVPPTNTLQVTPTSATVAPGGSVQFQVSTTSGKPVTWSVVGVGTVTQAGLYTAPL